MHDNFKYIATNTQRGGKCSASAQADGKCSAPQRRCLHLSSLGRYTTISNSNTQGQCLSLKPIVVCQTNIHDTVVPLEEDAIFFALRRYRIISNIATRAYTSRTVVRLTYAHDTVVPLGEDASHFSSLCSDTRQFQIATRRRKCSWLKPMAVHQTYVHGTVVPLKEDASTFLRRYTIISNIATRGGKRSALQGW